MQELGLEDSDSVVVHPTAVIAEGSEIGPNVVIGPGVVVGPGCKIINATIFEGTVLKGYSYINSSIIGWQNTVGRWCRLESVFSGEDV